MADGHHRHNLFVVALLTAALGWNATARAEISSSPKGLIGGALLGAELTVIGGAIAGVETEWMYLAGAGLGGVAGGVGGYFVDDQESPGWSVAMLVGGMALSIPALVLSLDATRRHWPEPRERRLPNEPTSNPPDPNSGPELTLHALPKSGSKLLRWPAASSTTADGGAGSERKLVWSLPDIYFGEAFSLADRQRYSLPVATVIQVPVFATTW